MLKLAKGLAGAVGAAALMFSLGGNIAYAAIDSSMTGTDPVTVKAERSAGGGLQQNSKDKTKNATGATGTNSASKKGGTATGTQSASQHGGGAVGSTGAGNASGNNGNNANGNNGQQNNNGQEKVTICHRTGSATNPWVVITVARPAWENGHRQHGDVLVGANGSCPAGTPAGTENAGGTNNTNTNTNTNTNANTNTNVGGNTNTNANVGGNANTGTTAGNNGAPVLENAVVVPETITLVVNGQTFTIPAGSTIGTLNGAQVVVTPSGLVLPLPAGAQVGTQLGVQTAPAGQAETMAGAPMGTAQLGSTLGVQSGGMAQTAGAVAGISTLPSTSSIPVDLPLGALGASAAALGAILLRRPRR